MGDAKQAGDTKQAEDVKQAEEVKQAEGAKQAGGADLKKIQSVHVHINNYMLSPKKVISRKH